MDSKKVEVKELKTIWGLGQLLDNSAEKEFFKEAILKFNIHKIVPHKWIGRFRCDFVIDNIFLIQIKEHTETSGKIDFFKDAKKERYFQKRGYFCITFWAEEVLLNPEGCINKTIEIINAHSNLIIN